MAGGYLEKWYLYCTKAIYVDYRVVGKSRRYLGGHTLVGLCTISTSTYWAVLGKCEYSWLKHTGTRRCA